MPSTDTVVLPRTISEKIVDFFAKNNIPLTKEQCLLSDRAVANALKTESVEQKGLFDFFNNEQLSLY